MGRSMKWMAIAVIALMSTVSMVPLLNVASEASRGPVNNSDSEPNDNRADATVIDTNVNVQGTLLSTDHWDNYKFQLSAGEKMTVDVVFDGALPLVSVYLRDGNGLLLDFMRDSKNSDVYAVGYSGTPTWFYLNITDDLLLGETYNATFTKSTVSGYTSDGNNDPTEAEDVATFPFYKNGTPADGDTEPTDHQDFYKVNLKRTLTKADLLVAFLTQTQNAQFVIDIYDNSLNTVEAYERTDDPEPGANYTHSYGTETAGYYYVRVWAANGTGTYDLAITVVEIDLDDDNDKPENATAMAIINNHTAQFAGNVGEDLDLNDYYSYEAMEGQVINVTIASEDYDPATRLPKMHISFLESDGATQYDIDPNTTDEQMDPDGYTNTTAPETGLNTNYLRIFVDNVASGGGAYTATVFTDRRPEVDDALVHDIIINESTVDDPSLDDSIKLADLFYDPDAVDDLTYSYEIYSEKGMDDPSNFTVEIGADTDMTVTLTPKPGDVGGIGWKGSGELTFIATDPYGLNATAIFPVQVKGTNHAPFLEYPFNETLNITPDCVLVYNETELNDTIDLFDIFTDLDTSDILNFEVNGTGPAVEEKKYGYSSVQDRHYLKSATINESFVVAFDLKNNFIDHKGPITIRLADTDKVKAAKSDRTPLEEEVWFWANDDGIPQKVSEKVRLVIQATSPEGTPPKWTASFNKVTFDEDTTKTVDFDLYTSDIDPQDQRARVYSVTNHTSNITVEKVDRNHYRFSALQDWHGTVKDVQVHCTDTFGLTKTTTIEIVVTSVPDAPVKVSTTPAEDASLNIDEGEGQAFHIEITDVDSDPAADLEFNWSIDGTWLRTVVGDTYTYLASYTAAGTHIIIVNVSERANPGLTVTANWTIVVDNVNRGPQQDTVLLLEPKEGSKYKLKTVVPLRAGEATDPDGDTLTYTWKIDGTVVFTGRTYDTKDIKKGEHVITLEVTDGTITVTRAVNITIREAGTEEQAIDMTTVGLLLVILIVIIIVVAAVMMKGRERPVKEEEPDMYAADRAAMKDAMRKADKKEEDEGEEEDASEEE